MKRLTNRLRPYCLSGRNSCLVVLAFLVMCFPHLCESGDLVGTGKNPGAPGARNIEEIEWPHVGADHGGNIIIDGEVAAGVFFGDVGVVEAVGVVAVIVPVVEVVVVKNGGFDQLLIIDSQMEDMVDLIGNSRYAEDVVVGGRRAVLNEILHVLYSVIFSISLRDDSELDLIFFLHCRLL